MAHVFYADKSPLNGDTQPGWSSELKYVFKFMEWWNRYRIYNLFPVRNLFWLNAIGNIAGKLVLKPMKSYLQKVEQSYLAFYPQHKNLKKKIRIFRKAHNAYLGKLMFAFMAGLPNRFPPPSTQFARFENLHLLDRELAKKKGVIIPITHLGELTQAIWPLTKHLKKYIIATVVYVPHMGIYKYLNHPYYDNLFLYASTSFSKISHFLEDHLRKNHIIMIYYDFGNKNQFRVPFWQGKYPYLIHTPQSPIRLHKKTGASILPCINLPDGRIGRVSLKFIENSGIMALSQKYWNSHSNELHGHLSTKLNQMFAPYLRAYAHVWEQLTDFGTVRTSDQFIIEASFTILQVIEGTFSRMKDIIVKSFEPQRQDAKIVGLIDSLQNQVINLISNPDQIFANTEIIINLSKMTAISELQKISTVLADKFHQMAMKDLSEIFSNFVLELNGFQTFLAS